MHIIGKAALAFVIGVAAVSILSSRGKQSASASATTSGGPALFGAHSSRCQVSFERFDSKTAGMSYTIVEQILGCPGREMSRSDIAGYSTVMYGWDGQGMLGSNMNAMFQNGSLVNKAQFGLR